MNHSQGCSQEHADWQCPCGTHNDSRDHCERCGCEQFEGRCWRGANRECRRWNAANPR